MIFVFCNRLRERENRIQSITLCAVQRAWAQVFSLLSAILNKLVPFPFY
jgi:hypothetical protein